MTHTIRRSVRPARTAIRRIAVAALVCLNAQWLAPLAAAEPVPPAPTRASPVYFSEPARALDRVPQARTGDRVAREIACLALNVYFEARSEPLAGMRAVAHVTMNRRADPRYPDTACSVITDGGEHRRHRCQFSWFCDGKPDRPTDTESWRTSLAVARGVYWGATPDPTHGALWYHAEYVQPAWRTALSEGPRIGRHTFYQDPARETSARVPDPTPRHPQIAQHPWPP